MNPTARAKQADKANPSYRKRLVWILCSLFAILFLTGAIWGTSAWLSNRRIANALRIQDLLMDESLTDAKLREGNVDELLDAIDGMSQSERERLAEKMFQVVRGRMNDKLRSYLSLPENKKVGFITTEMFRMQARANEFKRIGDKLGMGGPNGGPPGMRPPAGGWQNMSKEDRDAMRRRFLDRTTSEERALWSAAMEDFSKYKNLFPFQGIRPRGGQAQ
jgi:hypothetical protein